MKELLSAIENLTKRIELLEEKVAFLTPVKTKTIANTKQSTEKIVRDKTRYMFNGKVYPKNKLVLAVVQEYVKQNPQVSYEKLSTVFDKSLQGSLGVVRLYEEVKTRNDVSKRFFTKNIIKLSSGQEVVVCTQWGVFNIDQFILRAKSLDFNIAVINQMQY